MDRTTFLAKAAGFRRQMINIDGLGEVWVREVSAAEAQDQAKRATAKDADELTNAAAFVVRVLCDEQGQPILSDADIPTLKTMPVRVLRSISETAGDLSGHTADAKKNGSNG